MILEWKQETMKNELSNCNELGSNVTDGLEQHWAPRHRSGDGEPPRPPSRMLKCEAGLQEVCWARRLLRIFLPLTFSPGPRPLPQPLISSPDLCSICREVALNCLPTQNLVGTPTLLSFLSFRFFVPTAMLLIINYYKCATSDWWNNLLYIHIMECCVAIYVEVMEDLMWKDGHHTLLCERSWLPCDLNFKY